MSRLTDWLGRTFVPGVAQDQQVRHARRDPEWVDPYPDAAAEIDRETARLAGEKFRREFTPLFGETVQDTGIHPQVERKAQPGPDALTILNARRDEDLTHYPQHGEQP